LIFVFCLETGLRGLPPFVVFFFFRLQPFFRHLRWKTLIKKLHRPGSGGNWKDILAECGEHDALTVSLTRFSQSNDLPLVLVMDEIDALVGDTLISVLRQIRSGYPQRPGQFPSSIVLCGVRDVRDYRIHSGSGKEIITGGSAFNIKAKSLRMGDFVKEEVDLLLVQHTKETGQKFTPDAVACIWHLSQGHPWLVNALAYEVCFEMKDGRDRTRPIDKERVDQAKENLILRRETHLDQLADKLRESRVHRVIEGVLSGRAEVAGNLPGQDGRGRWKRWWWN
jgi:hypothetical protein